MQTKWSFIVLLLCLFSNNIHADKEITYYKDMFGKWVGSDGSTFNRDMFGKLYTIGEDGNRIIHDYEKDYLGNVTFSDGGKLERDYYSKRPYIQYPDGSQTRCKLDDYDKNKIICENESIETLMWRNYK